MEEKLFNQLSQGVEEMKAIRRGKMKPARTTILKPESPQVVRARLGFSQRKFSQLLGISIDTLQNWEQGRREPTGAAKILLKVVALNPKIVLKAAAA